MKHYLFIILTLIALSACSVVEDITGTGDDADNTGNNTGGGNTVTDNTNGDNTDTGGFTSFADISTNSNIDFTSDAYSFSSNSNGGYSNKTNESIDITLKHNTGKLQQVISDNPLYAIDELIDDAGFISGSKTITDDYSYSDSFFIMANPNDANRQWNYQSYILMNDIYYQRYGGESHEHNYYAYSIGAKTIGNDLPVADTAFFAGDGRGKYKASDNTGGQWETINFAIIANANFGTDSVTLEAKEVGTNYDLDFTGILEYEYKDNNLSGSITNRSDLSGYARAYFYGDKAQEIGGRFYFDDREFSNRTILIGAFGAKQVGNIRDVIDEFSLGLDSVSFHFNEYKLHDTLAVTQDYFEDNYNFVNMASYFPNEVISPSVTFTYDAHGQIVKTNISIADSYDIDDKYLYLHNINEWKYQNYALWRQHRDGVTGIYGVFSTGFATAKTDIPNDIAGETIFTGSGTAFYSGGYGAYRTDFEVRFKVNLNNNIADGALLSITNLTHLNFTDKQLDYDTVTGRFSNQSLAVGDLTGRVDAQFYGNKAQEVGGIINLSSASGDEYYIGAFGAKQIGDFGLDTVHYHFNEYELHDTLAVTQDYDINGNGRFDNSFANDGRASYFPNEVISPSVTFSYNANGRINNANISIADSYDNFRSNTGILQSGFRHDIDGKYLYLRNNISEWKYQTYALWNQDRDGYATGIHGALSTGLATAKADIPNDIAGATIFTGSGTAFYLSRYNIYHVEFTVSFKVNLNDDIADGALFSINNSRGYSFNGHHSGSTTDLSHLDFTDKQLDYDTVTGRLSNESLAVGALTGRVDAQFYGNEAQEVGGIINLSSANGDENYIGAFGAKR